MHNDITIRELDDNSIDAVAGGPIPVALAVAGAFIGTAGTGAAFGYKMGTDRANRDNRN
ncbi:MAG: class IIb bacteriocin, lactobin A/cerein 7B family [Alphaproteobacteria bacterium]|nr:class IIb bacteriocin, lactobin A/cerein 7B family [Alphaproteobacteria bacterium]